MNPVDIFAEQQVEQGIEARRFRAVQPLVQVTYITLILPDDLCNGQWAPVMFLYCTGPCNKTLSEVMVGRYNVPISTGHLSALSDSSNYKCHWTSYDHVTGN